MQRRKFCSTLGVSLALLLTLLLLNSASAASTYKVLYTFTGGNDGAYAISGLTSDSAGNLYGTTALGGAYGAGAVYKLALNPDGTWTQTVLHSFADFDDGAYPDWSHPVFDNAGSLYGTTYSGGGIGNCGYGHGCGTVYKLAPNPDGSWTESVLHIFGSGTDSRRPEATLVLDKAGNLYGTATEGGIYGGGTVFMLSPNFDGSWTESVLYEFKGQPDGGMSWGGVIFDAALNSLYGTTRSGGTHGYGTIFKLTPNPDGTWTESVLHNFKGTKDGSNSQPGLAFDTLGNFYGAAVTGGTYGSGTIFTAFPNPGGGWTGHVIHQFTGAKDGGNPAAPPVIDVDGNVYGVTAGGGRGTCQIEGASGCGVVFKITPVEGGRWTGEILYRFSGGADGGNPYGGPLVLDEAGNLYGTAFNRGTYGYGVVFQITP